jgi:mRNA interferase MazF
MVVSRAALGLGGLITWTLMITNMLREPWPGDIDIPNAEQIGLLIPSKIRAAKIAPIETEKASLIGRLDPETLAQALQFVRDTIG